MSVGALVIRAAQTKHGPGRSVAKAVRAGRTMRYLPGRTVEANDIGLARRALVKDVNDRLASRSGLSSQISKGSKSSQHDGDARVGQIG